MAKYIIFENNYKGFLASAEKLIVVKVGWAPDALIFGPIWPFRYNLWPQLVLGLILTFGVNHFFGWGPGFIAWFIYGVFLFFAGNEIRVTSLKEKKSYKFLDEIEANGPEEAKSKYHSKRKEAEYVEAEERRDAAKELKEKEELAKAKKEEEQRNLIKAAIKSEVEEKLDKVKQSDDTKDHIVNLEQARSLLIDKKITTSEYIKKAEELKEQENPAKVKQSNESTDYIGELEKAKKLRDDDDIDIDDYEILKQDIMSKIQSK